MRAKHEQFAIGILSRISLSCPKMGGRPPWVEVLRDTSDRRGRWYEL